MTHHTPLEEVEYQPLFALPPREFPPVLGFVTDCSDSFAQSKVALAKISALGSNWEYLPTIGIPSFQTDVLGIQGAVIAQYLGEYSQKHHVPAALILNCAPREKGEGLIGGEILIIELDNGIPVLLTNGPGVLEPFQDRIVGAWKIATDIMVDNGVLQPTQFRSFQWFSDILSKFLYQDRDLEKTAIDDIETYVIDRHHSDDFVWLVDSFGNVKLSIADSTIRDLGIEEDDVITLRIAGREFDVTKRDKLFPLPADVGDNHIGHYRGSDRVGSDHYWEIAIAWKSVADFIENDAPLVDRGSVNVGVLAGSHVEIASIRRGSEVVYSRAGERPAQWNGSDTSALSKRQLRSTSPGVGQTL